MVKYYIDLKNPIVYSNMNSPIIYKIRELNLDTISPISSRAHEPEYGGSKIVVIGKPNTGKTTLIASLLYAKKHIFPVGMVMSGSEDSNGFYRNIFPSSFVYNEYNEEKIKDFVRRQKIAKQHVSVPWGVLLLDDCTDDPRIFNKPLQHGLFKRGRHFKMWYILSLQYSMDVKPVIRTNVDGIFILREPILKNRKSLWENYASVIPDFNLFCEILDQVTDDFTALYIDNTSRSNDWQDCVFWYKAKLVPKDWKLGCKDMWAHHFQRYNPEYTDPLI
jgi:hypothetical protein